MICAAWMAPWWDDALGSEPADVCHAALRGALLVWPQADLIVLVVRVAEHFPAGGRRDGARAPRREARVATKRGRLVPGGDLRRQMVVVIVLDIVSAQPRRERSQVLRLKGTDERAMPP